MMKKYLAAAVFAGSLLAAPAFAQTASSCDAMLKDFDNHLTTNSIQPNDPRVTQARTQAEQACMSGDMTTAESSLDRAVADLGIPPRSGKSGGANGGATESGSTSSQGTGSTNNTTGTGQSGTQNSNNTGSTTSGSTTSGSTGSNSGQSGSTSSTQ
jgi:hypothetical protein